MERERDLAPDAAAEVADAAVRAFARWWPAWASDQGAREHDARLADPTAEGHRAVAEGLRALLARLPPEGVSLDADAVRYALEVELHDIEELALHRRDPDLARELFDHLFGLLAKPGGRSADVVADGLVARLEGAPAFLAAGRTRIALDEVPRLWAEVAIESAQEAPALLDAVAGALAADGRANDPRARAALERARRALAEHETWLRGDVLPRARGRTEIGGEAFERLLAVRRIGARGADLLDLASRLVVELRGRVEEAARTVLASRGREPGPDPVAGASEVVREDRPRDFASVLAAYARAGDEARAFVVARGLAGVPDVPLAVRETPAYLRHLVPFAAYMDPGRWATAPEGVYLVTPKADLGAFHAAEVRTTTVHEAWPGHHLQLGIQRTLPLPRFLPNATEYVEGWALYCEALMLQHGFLASPDERFVQAKDALWRALRIRLDVGLATGRISFEEAVADLRDVLGFTEEDAEAEVKRYTLEPGYNLCYMWGKVEIDRLRRAWESRGGNERAFHDSILAAGALPIPLLERHLDAAGNQA